MAGNTKIRIAGPDDVPELVEIVKTHGIWERYRFRGEEMINELTLAMEAGDVVLVAETPWQLAGMAWFQKQSAFNKSAYLRLMAVRAGMEELGIGSLLLLEGEEQLADMGRSDLMLLVSDFNQSAQSFYEQHGYNRIGQLPGYILPEADEFIYWKRFRTKS